MVRGGCCPDRKYYRDIYRMSLQSIVGGSDESDVKVTSR
jgi:hypothetical protein